MSTREVGAGLLLATTGLVLAACDSGDIGDVCDGMVVPDSQAPGGDPTRTEGAELVEYNVLFPCDEPVCVATLGRGAYCSKECDRNGQCPTGFECREVMQLGPFAGRNFCVWSVCAVDSDCGNPWVAGCERVAELSLNGDVKLCKRRE